MKTVTNEFKAKFKAMKSFENEGFTIEITNKLNFLCCFFVFNLLRLSYWYFISRL